MAVPAPHAALTNLWQIAEPSYASVLATRVIVRENDGTVDGVLGFMYDNDLDVEDMKDVVYSIIVSQLVNAQIVISDGTPTTTQTRGTAAAVGAVAGAAAGAGPRPLPAGIVNANLVRRYSGLAKTMALVALHAYAAGAKTGEVSWYESFCSVKGRFLSESRFKLVTSLIIDHGNVGQICQVVTIADLQGENNVLRYRLERLSSPSLVGQALSLLPFDMIHTELDQAAIARYRDFFNGGLQVQIAAGPLAEFCKGMADPFTPQPPDTVISEFTPLPVLPYDAPLLRKVHIILDICGALPRKWYQGMKAIQGKTTEDIRFEAIVKYVYSAAQKVEIPREGLLGKKLKEPKRPNESGYTLPAGSAAASFEGWSR